MGNVLSTHQQVLFYVIKDFLFKAESVVGPWSTTISPPSLEGTCFSQLLLYFDNIGMWCSEAMQKTFMILALCGSTIISNFAID